MKIIDLAIIIIIIIIITIILHKKYDYFASLSQNDEAIANVASLYNSGNFTANNMTITKQLCIIDGGDSPICLSGDGKGNLVLNGGLTVNNVINANGGITGPNNNINVGGNLNITGGLTATGDIGAANIGASGNVSGNSLNSTGGMTLHGPIATTGQGGNSCYLTMTDVNGRNNCVAMDNNGKIWFPQGSN